MIFQDPLSALNPSQRIGRQVGEILRRNGSSRSDADRAAVALMEQAGFPNHGPSARLPAPVLRRYATAGDDRSGLGR